jgi:hypothetical protein
MVPPREFGETFERASTRCRRLLDGQYHVYCQASPNLVEERCAILEVWLPPDPGGTLLFLLLLAVTGECLHARIASAGSQKCLILAPGWPLWPRCGNNVSFPHFFES